MSKTFISLWFLLVGALSASGCGQAASSVEVSASMAQVILKSKAIKEQKSDPYYKSMRGSRCLAGKKNLCHYSIDTRGRRVTDCNLVYDSCRHHRWNPNEEKATLFLVKRTKQYELETFTLARRYQLPYKKTAVLLDAISEARRGNLIGARWLNLSEQELYSFIQTQSLSSDQLARVSWAMGTTPNNIQKFLESLRREAQQQGRSLNSPMWQTCFAYKRWSTNLANYCADHRAQGCSPRTGATGCAPIIR